MVDEPKVTGTLIESFLICKRQAWFQLHKVIPFQDHPLLEIGRLIDETSYERSFKSIVFDNVKIDFVKTKSGELVVGEVKKSSKVREVAKMQLLFYLKYLKDVGIPSRGILCFPTEKRREFVELTLEEEAKIVVVENEIKKLSTQNKPPLFKKCSFCKNCAYREFCFI